MLISRITSGVGYFFCWLLGLKTNREERAEMLEALYKEKEIIMGRDWIEGDAEIYSGLVKAIDRLEREEKDVYG